MRWVNCGCALLAACVVGAGLQASGFEPRTPVPSPITFPVHGYYPRLNPLHLLHPCTKPKYQTGIPLRDYQYRPTSPIVTAFSKSGVPVEHRSKGDTHFKIDPATGRPLFDKKGKTQVETVSNGVLLKRSKIFQLDVAKLEVNHCSISQVAFMVEEEGIWTLSLRADQNPLITGEMGNVPPFRPQLGLDTDFLKRNEFFVTIRCHGFFVQQEKEQFITTGKPVLLELEIPSFWVQRAQPYYLSLSGTDPRVTRYFDEIDRIEVEFFYR